MTNATSTFLPLRHELSFLVRAALAKVSGLAPEVCDPILVTSKNPSFGDYQSNAAMGLAKKLCRQPRSLAQDVEQTLLAQPVFTQLVERIEVAGPGFLNFYLHSRVLSARLESGLLDQSRILSPEDQQTIVIDYSSPNIAKEMHVGHIRSTILGDAMARILEFLGHRVVRQNHLGDWGTPFGMLLAYFQRFPEKLDEHSLSDIEANYRAAHDLFQHDHLFEAEARQAVVDLHHGQAEALALWEKVVSLSKRHLHSNYQRLGVKLSSDHDRGESFYNPMLGDVVQELKSRFGQATGPLQVREDAGATCLYMYDNEGNPLYKNKEGHALPFIIEKSDGAYLYATTDLAALRFRVQQLKANWIIIVTDNRQAQQMDMMFTASHLAGFDRPSPEDPPVKLQHVTFGAILGADRRPLKTREGGSIKLSTLVDEAIEHALPQVSDLALEGGLSPHQVAEKIGIGAIKYADLSQNRQTDYVFSWEKLLSLKGNTAPYFSFAYARLSSILRKSQLTDFHEPIDLSTPYERHLALLLCRFTEIIEVIPQDWQVNVWTDYLYQLASACMLFLENCPVLHANTPELVQSRLHLAARAAHSLKIGLNLLGIDLVDRM